MSTCQQNIMAMFHTDGNPPNKTTSLSLLPLLRSISLRVTSLPDYLAVLPKSSLYELRPSTPTSLSLAFQGVQRDVGRAAGPVTVEPEPSLWWREPSSRL